MDKVFKKHFSHSLHLLTTLHYVKVFLQTSFLVTKFIVYLLMHFVWKYAFFCHIIKLINILVIVVSDQFLIVYQPV